MSIEAFREGAGAEPAPALSFRRVGFRYRSEAAPALVEVDFKVEAGERIAVVGGNGSGKSTLARLCNGLLLPSSGEVAVGGLITSDESRIWHVRSRVGLLFQDPEDQIVGATVQDDVAFGLENLGVPREEMRRRVEETLRAVGLAGEADTEPHLLSGGQKQRLALAGVMVLRPSVLVLDEPTSMLDPKGRRDVMAFAADLQRSGVAVVFITQHMDEVAAADRVLALQAGRMLFLGSPREFFQSIAAEMLPLAPPGALSLGRRMAAEAPWLGLNGADLPLTEKELIGTLRAAIRRSRPAGACPRTEAPDLCPEGTAPDFDGEGPTGEQGARPSARGPAAVTLTGVGLTYNAATPFARRALENVDLEIPAGRATAVVGATASGKSSLLQLMAGLLAPSVGTIQILGSQRPRPGEVGMVFQRPELQLFSATVADDVSLAPRLAGVADAEIASRTDWALDMVGLDPSRFRKRSPVSLSQGEQRRVALAGILSLRPRILILDEPGSGLDPAGRERLVCRLTGLAEEGITVVFSSHDMEEVARTAHFVVVLASGRVVAAGAPAAILGDCRLMAAAGLRPALTTSVAAALCRQRPSPAAASPAAAALPVHPHQLAEWLAACLERQDSGCLAPNEQDAPDFRPRDFAKRSAP